ncbi:MAG TPA: heavy-metal-associated domain-containing protein [Thermoanaerobaculia bacterium]|nr:heavy-metal-associated domain-containing protein [Thermoanaerobaculia bacterium]HXK66919.1 heavy-metal-associated domain-containing protein [Thermoanaerobaculia bacterium]
MKKSFLLLAMILFASFILVADEAELKLTGVHCPVGAAKVEKALKAVKGVADVKINIENAVAKVIYDGKIVKPEDMVAAVKTTGYSAEMAAGEKAHACPTIGVQAVDEFHLVLHGMHEAMNEGNLDGLKKDIDAMKGKRDALLKHCQKAVEEAPCPESRAQAKMMADMAEGVSKSVDNLEKALQSGTKEEVTKAFDAVHENFYKILDQIGS